MIYAIRNNNMLVELTQRQWRTAELNRAWGTSRWTVERITAQQAHQWVRKGYTHETALWIDCDGRIRRATDNS
jgi:hypothetical protein